MPFSTIYLCEQCTCPCFPRVLFISTLHNILSKPLVSFPYNHHQNDGQQRERDTNERGMNSVAMAIFNPWREYWESNQRLPNLKSCTLLTDLHRQSQTQWKKPVKYTVKVMQTFTIVSDINPSPHNLKF